LKYIYSVGLGDLPDVALKMGRELLDLSHREAATFDLLPRLGHKDPFDRMLVRQAIGQGVTIQVSGL
jgi:PIN domain nuclease of toxin-antitoxin system